MLPELTKQDIWLAYPALVVIGGGEMKGVSYPGAKLPSEVSLGIARLMDAIVAPYWIIEREREVLARKYGKLDKKRGLIIVAPDSDKAGDFTLEFGNLLGQQWPAEIEFEKVRLPLKISSVCTKCGQVTETVFQIEPQLLLPLVEYFIEIDPG